MRGGIYTTNPAILFNKYHSSISNSISISIPLHFSWRWCSVNRFSARSAGIYFIIAMLFLIIPYVSGCGGSGIQGFENAGSTIDGSSVSKSLNSANKDKSSKQCLYSKVTYTLDNGEKITYQFDPNTLSAVTPSESSSQDSSSSSTQETRSYGAMRQAYDGTVMGAAGVAYVTDKLVASSYAYTFFPGAGIAEEYIVCPEPSVYPESNFPRQGVTVVPSLESGLGPIVYTPTVPSFTGAVHIVANYNIPGDPPKPWHESWDFIYLVDDPVPQPFKYYNQAGYVMGLEFKMGIGSDTEDVVLPRTLGGWHFISNNNMAHYDDIINMRELSIKDPVTFVADEFNPNKIKIQAGIEELPAGSWTAEIAGAKDDILDPNTQETTTIDLIWNSVTKYLTGDWFYKSGDITAALSKGFSLTVREIANLYMHTITAYEDTVKTYATKSAGQEIAKLTIENAKATPEEFSPSKKGENNTTNITAQIVAKNFQVDTINWQVTIKNEADATVKTFETRTGASGSGPWDVSETWDGKNDVGDFVDYGTYSFNIAATATSNGTVIKAKAVVSVKVAPQFPTLTKLTFDNILNIANDFGEKLKPIYYKAKDSEITQNPFAIPLSRLTPVDSDKAKGKCNITLEIPHKPVKAISFEVRIKSHSDTVIVEKEYVTFDGNKKESSKDVDFTVPSKIQTIEGVIVEYRIVKNEGGDWISQSDWKEDAIAKPNENIWITLNEPINPPLSQHGKKLPPVSLINLACYLADNTINENDVRVKTFIELRKWLKENNFYYDPSSPHSILGSKGLIFDYIGFTYNALYPEIEGVFVGNCSDISALYALCCSAIGVEMKLALYYSEPFYDSNPMKKFTAYKIRSSGTLEADGDNDGWRIPEWFNWRLKLHQVGSLNRYVFDPTFEFQTSYIPNAEKPVPWINGTAINVIASEYIEYLVKNSDSPTKWYTKPREYPIQSFYPSYVIGLAL